MARSNLLFHGFGPLPLDKPLGFATYHHEFRRTPEPPRAPSKLGGPRLQLDRELPKGQPLDRRQSYKGPSPGQLAE